MRIIFWDYNLLGHIPGRLLLSLREYKTKLSRRTVTSSRCQSFHYTPFYSHMHQKLASSPIPLRVHNELYSLDSWLDAHRVLLQRFLCIPYAPIEITIIGLMFQSGSDAKHLQVAQFGTAFLWPVYNSCEHIAYLPTVCSKTFSYLTILISLIRFVATIRFPK